MGLCLCVSEAVMWEGSIPLEPMDFRSLTVGDGMLPLPNSQVALLPLYHPLYHMQLLVNHRLLFPMLNWAWSNLEVEDAN